MSIAYKQYWIIREKDTLNLVSSMIFRSLKLAQNHIIKPNSDYPKDLRELNKYLFVKIPLNQLITVRPCDWQDIETNIIETELYDDTKIVRDYKV